jgi:hypothetical protein
MYLFTSIGSLAENRFQTFWNEGGACSTQELCFGHSVTTHPVATPTDSPQAAHCTWRERPAPAARTSSKVLSRSLIR